MDPISIITLAASTTAATYQVSQYLYMFINSAHNVDDSIEGLGREVTGLRRVLDAITATFEGGIFKSDKATAVENSPIWAAVAGSLNDCRTTLEDLAEKMAKVTNSASSKNFFRQSLRLIKLRSWGNDIQAIRVNVNAHANNLQISLQMVNILALGQSPEQAVEQLGEKVDRLTQSLADLQTREEREMQDAKSNGQLDKVAPQPHHALLKRTANEALAKRGNILNSGRLDIASRQDQQASTAFLEHVITDFNRSLYDFDANPQAWDETTDDGQTSNTDSDDDTTLEIAEISFLKGNERYNKKQFAEAEAHFRDGLQHISHDPRHSKSFDLEDIRLKLIKACIAQEKWQESELMLMMLLKQEDRNRITANTLSTHHLLALTFLCQYEFELAVYHCKLAANGRRRLFGKHHTAYSQSMRLLALIYEANGDTTSSSVFLRKVLAKDQNIQEYEPVTLQFFGYSTAEHLRMSLKEKQAAIGQLSENKLTERPFKFGSDSLNMDWALTRAAFEGLEMATRWLLAKGADPQSSSRGDSALVIASSKGHEAVALSLLQSGADVNIGDGSEMTPLSWASLWGHESTVRLLLQFGADVEKPDTDGSTPLINAATKGHASVVKLLLSNGAKIEAKTRPRGNTSLLIAASQNHVDVARLLIEHGANVEAKNNEGKTPLLLAAGANDGRLVELLVNAGADVNAQDSRGATALLLVTQRKVGTLRFLLEHGAHPDVKNEDGQTPLLKAADWNHYLALGILLEWGADPSNKLHGRNVLQIARSRGSQECISILQEFGALEE